MFVVDMVPFAAAAIGAVVVMAHVLPWGRRPAGISARGFAAIVDEAPVVLRPAVVSFAATVHARQMFTALHLGSPELGYPRVQDWDYAPHGLTVDLVMRGGQTLSDWSHPEVCERIAHYVGAEKVTAWSPAPGWVRLDIRVVDTLSGPVTPAPAELPAVAGTEVPAVWGADVTAVTGVDLEAVPVGVREDGAPWLLRILYAHILLAGATGSGKGSVLWSIIAGLGPAIKAGFVDVWMADPKGGVEFGVGADRLFVRFATDAPSILAVLAEAVEVMTERTARLRAARLRKLVPTTDEPLIVIVIDEAASLSSYATAEERAEFRRLTGLLQSQGRAVGVSVIAALQDPSKEVMPNRQLFPTRIGLRLDEPNQVAMIHGQGARDRGALCDQIPTDTPGVGYVGEDGSTEFVRVRAFWLDDQAIDAVVDTYAPAPAAVDLAPQADYSGFDPDDLGDTTDTDTSTDSDDDGDDGAAGVLVAA